jgi:hypothetical protein
LGTTYADEAKQYRNGLQWTSPEHTTPRT